MKINRFRIILINLACIIVMASCLTLRKKKNSNMMLAISHNIHINESDDNEIMEEDLMYSEKMIPGLDLPKYKTQEESEEEEYK